MTTNNKLARFKQQRMQSLVGKSDSYSFFNLLTGPEMFTKVEELLPEVYRERQFPPTETLSMFLAQAMNEDRSCQKIVNDVAVRRAMGGLSPCSTHTGGYCQARQRLPLDMVSTLTRYTDELMSEQVSDHWRWHGKRVHLIDGTTVTIVLRASAESPATDAPKATGNAIVERLVRFAGDRSTRVHE